MQLGLVRSLFARGIERTRRDAESFLLQQFPMVVVRAAVLLYKFRAAARPAAVKEVA